MSTISFPSVGTFHNLAASGTNTPNSIAYNPGDILLLLTGQYMGSATQTAPSGWTTWSPNNNAKQIYAFALDSVGGDTIPSITWATNPNWTLLLSVHGSLSSATAVDVFSDRFTNTTSNIVGPSATITPTQNNETVLFIGHRNKTSTSDGSVYTPPSGFTMLAQQTVAGTRFDVIVAYQNQTTATSIPANILASGSIADSATQSMQSMIITIQSAPVGPPQALLSWPTQTFIEEKIIQY